MAWKTGGGGLGDYKYLVKDTGEVFDSSGNRKQSYGSDHDGAINWALANLTAARDYQERVVLWERKSFFKMGATLVLEK